MRSWRFLGFGIGEKTTREWNGSRTRLNMNSTRSEHASLFMAILSGCELRYFSGGVLSHKESHQVLFLIVLLENREANATTECNGILSHRVYLERVQVITYISYLSANNGRSYA